MLGKAGSQIPVPSHASTFHCDRGAFLCISSSSCSPPPWGRLCNANGDDGPLEDGNRKPRGRTFWIQLVRPLSCEDFNSAKPAQFMWRSRRRFRKLRCKTLSAYLPTTTQYLSSVDTYLCGWEIGLELLMLAGCVLLPADKKDKVALGQFSQHASFCT